MAKRRAIGCWVAFAILLVLGIVGVSFLSSGHDLSLIARKNGDQIELRFDLRNINGLERLDLWEKETKRTLWGVDLNFFREPLLVYGRVPSDFLIFNGERRSARQTLPGFSADAVPLPVGKEIAVIVQYQYDESFSACAGQDGFVLTINPDGTITCVKVHPLTLK